MVGWIELLCVVVVNEAKGICFVVSVEWWYSCELLRLSVVMMLGRFVKRDLGGGVSSLDDIRALADGPGLGGVITGKAVYEGRVDVADAIGVLEEAAR